GREAGAEVLAAGRLATLAIDAPRPARRVATRPVEVIQALPKGSKIDAIVRDAVELGATRISLVRSARSVRQNVDEARLRRIALEAARQSGRGDLPALAMVAWEEALACDAVGKICLHPRGDVPFARFAGAPSVAILIGPEGGFDDAELAAAETAGFALVRLGAFTMRTETACAAALGAVAALAP